MAPRVVAAVAAAIEEMDARKRQLEAMGAAATEDSSKRKKKKLPCRSCHTTQSLDMFYCSVTGRAKWTTCSTCRANDQSSYNGRYRRLRAVTHGYLCPIFTSYLKRWSLFADVEGPLDQVTLSTDNVSRKDVVGTYNIHFYVGSKLDFGPNLYSRQCGGTVILTAEKVTDANGQVSEKLKGCIQLGNGRVRMPCDLRRKEMDERNVLTTSIDQHSEHHNWYRPSSGSMNLTECDADAVAYHSERIALNKVSQRLKRLEVPGNTLAFKLDPTANKKGHGDNNTDPLTMHADDEEIFPTSETVHGFITIVSARTAVPRCCDDKLVMAMWHKVPDALTVEQGDMLMEQYNDVERSWLCRRLHLPETAAMNVRRFLKPKPVHFFEPGDVWIRFAYFEAKGKIPEPENKGHPALIVARKN